MKEEIESKLERLDKHVGELRNLSKLNLSEFRGDNNKARGCREIFPDINRDGYRYFLHDNFARGSRKPIDRFRAIIIENFS